MVERGTGIAVWRQIAGRLRADIAAGRYGSDGRLPNEIDLAGRFGVNRHTVRRAIADLAADGLVEARRGEGTFLAAPALAYPIGADTRFHEIVAGQARVPHGRLLASAREPATPALAARLGCPADATLLRLDTLHTADRIPISTATIHYVAERVPDLVADFAESGSLTAALRRAGIAAYLRGETRISALRASDEDAVRLDLAPDAVILETDYESIDADGMVFQHARTRFAAERVKLLVRGAAEI